METHTNLRPLNVLHDLPQVADLIEICFHKSMDSDDQSYVREMRRAGRDTSWLRSIEKSSSMPLNGYVWEEGGKIIGNASLILFRQQKRKIYMVANVAVHPESRRRGIGKAVTEQVMNQARQHGADEIWLNARDDNPDALDMYMDLGFTEHSRRTQWFSDSLPTVAEDYADIRIEPRHKRFWSTQLAWLTRLHPNELAWYRAWNFKGLAPGLWNWLYLMFVNVNLRQWAAVRAYQLQAVLSWVPSSSHYDPLWLALGPESTLESVTTLLVHARRELAERKFSLEHPSGAVDKYIRAAGFTSQRTLIWMRAEGATK
jgi:ribosomal-protein-alanine N-acetyltransferase